VAVTEEELSLGINRFEKLEPSTFHKRGRGCKSGTEFAYCDDSKSTLGYTSASLSINPSLCFAIKVKQHALFHFQPGAFSEVQ
jgi:hypothetical protein